MAGTIRISTQEVRSTAVNIRTLNGTLNDRLQDIQAQMNGLKATWQSDAGDAIQANFQGVAGRYFTQYQQVVDAYATFLETAVSESYETTERTLTGNASAFK